MAEPIERVDPDSRQGLVDHIASRPAGWVRHDDVVQRRAAAAELTRALVERRGYVPRVTREDRTVPGLDGDPEVAVRIYRPEGADGVLPGILFIHGGGMIGGSIEGEDDAASLYCLEAGAVVVSVEYRLAPEHPHPAAVRDCYAALIWFAGRAVGLGVDPAALAVVGGSAGGNLALGTALMARDHGGPGVAFVLASYPMLDPANVVPAARSLAAPEMWSAEANTEAWGWFLGGAEADRYASPLLESDWRGFPPTFIDVGTEDLFRDEDIALVGRMAGQGVMVEFHLYPGAYHSSEFIAPEAELSRRIMANRIAALRRHLVESPWQRRR